MRKRTLHPIFNSAPLGISILAGITLPLLLAGSAAAQVVVTDNGEITPTQGLSGTGFTGSATNVFGFDQAETHGQRFTLANSITLDSIYIGYSGFGSDTGTFTITVDAGNDGSNEISVSGITLDSADFSGIDQAAPLTPVYWMRWDLSSLNLILPAGTSSFLITCDSEGSPGSGWLFAPMYNNSNPYAGGRTLGLSGGNANNDALFVVTALVPDADGDGLSDDYELTNTDPPSTTALVPGLDDDSDGLTNEQEFLGQDSLGSDHGFGQTRAILADTDGDGIEDGAEVAGTDNDDIVHGYGATNPNKGDSDADDVVAPTPLTGEQPYKRQKVRGKKNAKYLAAKLQRQKRKRAVRSRSPRGSIRLLSKTDTHFCPLCDKGPKQKRELDSLIAKMDATPVEYESLWMCSALRKLTQQTQLYDQHLLQLANQRVFNKNLELLCTQNNRRGTMTRDFVSFYGPDGSKIRILVFVLLRARGLELSPTYIYFVYWGDDFGNDGYFFRDAIDHVLCKTGFLDDLDVLGLNGDHGPHFSARCAFYYMSTVFERSLKCRPKRRSGLVVEEDFLTSYHAFNRCDGAGSVVKQACLNWWKEGGSAGWPSNAREICDMINKNRVSLKGMSSQMVAYPFDVIDRGDEVFKPCLGPSAKTTNLHKYPDLRQKCQVHYSWPVEGTETRLPGVIRVRTRSGIGPWTFMDTLHSATSDRGQMCEFHTNVAGTPVYHGEEDCPGDDIGISDADRIPPSMGRLANSGQQLVAKKKKVQKKKGAVTVPDLKNYLRAHNQPLHGDKAALERRAANFRPSAGNEDSDSDEDRRAASESDGNTEEESSIEEFAQVTDVVAYQKCRGQDQWKVRFDGEAEVYNWLNLAKILSWVDPKDHEETKLLLNAANTTTKKAKKRKRRQ